MRTKDPRSKEAFPGFSSRLRVFACPPLHPPILPPILRSLRSLRYSRIHLGNTKAACIYCFLAFIVFSGVGVSALGGTEPNQEVLTFSGFDLTLIPEPGTTPLIALLGTILLTLRRRPQQSK